MDGKYLLDSNIVIDIFRGSSDTIDRVKELGMVYIPTIVLGELYFGANKSSKTPKRISEIEQLEYNVTVLDVTKATARIYGEIKETLRSKGKMIPENDIWIAAVAMEHDLPLLTRDHHFQQVTGITIEML
jgi:tRNA(fMet)-specific endonuclease VapC